MKNSWQRLWEIKVSNLPENEEEAIKSLMVYYIDCLNQRVDSKDFLSKNGVNPQPTVTAISDVIDQVASEIVKRLAKG